MKYLYLYLVIINAIGFFLMLADKQKARKNRWRIPEKVLLSVAAIGGSLGSLIGMRLVRHKTKHAAFFIGIPIFLFAHILLLIFLHT